jgi:hypothetical protein
MDLSFVIVFGYIITMLLAILYVLIGASVGGLGGFMLASYLSQNTFMKDLSDCLGIFAGLIMIIGGAFYCSIFNLWLLGQ